MKKKDSKIKYTLADNRNNGSLFRVPHSNFMNMETRPNVKNIPYSRRFYHLFSACFPFINHKAQTDSMAIFIVSSVCKV